MKKESLSARIPAHACAPFASVRISDFYTKYLFFLVLGFLTALVFLKVEIQLLLGADEK